MARIILVIILASALFMTGAWSLGLLDDIVKEKPKDDPRSVVVKSPDKLGGDLYAAAAFKAIPKFTRPASDPTIVTGVLNPIEQEEVSSLVNGRILFIGEQVDDEAVLVGGSAAFLAEPYYFSSVYTGGGYWFVKFYRRIYDGETIYQNQMLGMVDPAEALGDVLGTMAKLGAAKAEYEASIHGEKEGQDRYYTALGLYPRGASKEELGSAKLTFHKLHSERVAKEQGVVSAEVDRNKAEVKLRMHEIRALLPYKQSTLKTILRQRGYAVKQLDPVVVVQNLGKLLAEAQIEEQYFAHLRNKVHITATIEPSIQDKPRHEFDAVDVTCVAVAKDQKIVSGSEDGSVSIWSPDAKAPLLKLEHEDAVKVIACTPTAADKNLCLAGCADGSLYLWDLDKGELFADRIKKAHGGNASITALAFSPDGKFFATGASDGSIRMWTTAEAKELYAFVPENGVEKCHEDAVTSLHFTPQCRLISAGSDKTLRIWRLKEQGAHADGKAILHRKGNVPSLGVSRDGRYMLFDRDQTLQMLSVEKRTLQHTMHVPVNSTPFDTLALFSPDDSLILTSGAAGEGRLQLWRTPDGDTRSFEVRQFATKDRQPVTSAAFAPSGEFAVSASGQKIHVWTIPTAKEVGEHRVERVRMTLKTQALDASTRQTRVGFEVINEFSERYPNGRFEAGRPVTIVID